MITKKDNINLRIVFNTSKGKQTGSSRIFFYNIYTKLKQKGFSVDLNNWDDYKDFDVAILYGPDHELEKAKEINPDILIGLSKLWDETGKDIKQLKAADFLIAETNLQRDYYLRYNKNIITLPLVEDIPGDLYKKHYEKDKTTLGYHGNKLHLEEGVAHGMKSALEKIKNKYNIELLAFYDIERCGKWEKNVPDIPVIHKQIDNNLLYKDLLSCDIGICPGLTPVFNPAAFYGPHSSFRIQNILLSLAGYGNYGLRNDFIVRYKNSSNSGRAFVFMSLGIPVVCEPIPQNCEVINNGINGFVVYTEEGWYDALEKLIIDSVLRENISKKAKLDICTKGYIIKSMIDKFCKEVFAIVNEKK